MLQRQGQVEADGSPSVAARREVQRPRPRPVASRISIRERVVTFFREVRSELRQVAWPTRVEVVNAAAVVFVVLVLLGASIFGLNWIFSHGFLKIFKV